MDAELVLLPSTTLQWTLGTSTQGLFSAPMTTPSHGWRWQYEQKVPEPETGYKGPPIRKGCGYEGSGRQPRGKCQGTPNPKLREQMDLVSPFGLESVVCLGTSQVRHRGVPKVVATPSSPALSQDAFPNSETPSKMYFPSDLGFNVGNSSD